MMTHAWYTVAVLAATTTTATPAAAGARLELARNGRSGYRILIADRTPPVVCKAAEMLQTYVAQATGCRLRIHTVGRAEALWERSLVVDDGWLAAKAGVDPRAAKLRPDGFVVRRAGTRVVLTGAPERGVLYAVTDFLEREVGCRWYAPERVVVPKRPRLWVTVTDRREQPAFHIRHPYVPADDTWRAANRSTATAGVWGDNPMASDGNAHSVYLIAPPNPYFKTHPDWYSSHNGVRFHHRGQINYHHPGLVRHFQAHAVAAFKRHPEWRAFNVCQNDWFGWSEDPTTNAMDAREGSVAASHVHFVNQVAAAVRREHPDRRLITLAYLQTSIPPRALRYEPNVVAMICTPDSMWSRALTRCGPMGKRWLAHVRTWASKCDMPMVWIYHQNYSPRYVVSPDVAGLQDDLRAFRACGIQGVFAEMDVRDKGTPFDDLRPYLITRLLWNPDLDVDALLADFHAGYYGPKAGTKMLAFYHAVCDGLDTFIDGAWSDDRLDRMERAATEARALATDDFARRRIDIALRTTVYIRLSQLTADGTFVDGYLQNAGHTPAAEQLKQQFNVLSRRIGDKAQLKPDDLCTKVKTVTVANNDLRLVVVPGSGAGIFSIVDRATGTDLAFRLPCRSNQLVGGYQELAGYSWSSPGVRTAFTVTAASARRLTLQAETDGLRLQRTITVPDTGLTFAVRSTMTNIGSTLASRGMRTHPMLTVGDPANCRFIYRTGDGKMHDEPMHDALNCRSAGWGPTGLWAVVNPKTNRGIVWRSPPGHNGMFFWASPDRGVFGCETFSRHADLKPGQTLALDQTFTILRDARAWCRQNNVAPTDRP